MTSTDPASITAAFKDYREQRYDHVKGQYDRSKVNAKIMYGQVNVILLLFPELCSTAQVK